MISMSSISCVSLEQIDLLNQNSKAISSFKQNDQIWTFGKRMVRIAGPEVSKEQNVFFQTVDKIIALAVKIILAIGRLFTGQNDEHSIQKLETMVKQLNEELKKTLPPTSGKEFYAALEGFGKIRRNLEQAVKSGLHAYKKATEEGTPYFIKGTPKARQACAEHIQLVLEQIESYYLPKIDGKIQKMKEAVSEKDTHMASAICLVAYKNNMKLVTKENLPNIHVLTDSVKAICNSSKQFERVLKYYGLDKRLTLTGTEVAAVLIGLAANITLRDINCDDEVSALATITEHRKIDYDFITATPDMKFRAQLQHDQKLLYILNDYKDFDPGKEPGKIPVESLRKYSYTEFLTRHLCYALFDGPKTQFPDGLLFPMIDKDNKVVLMEASKVVAGKGLYAALVKPAFIEDDQKEAPVELIFRGTYCRDSLLRDINPAERVLSLFFEGPGRASFEAKQDEIVKKVLEALKELIKKHPELKVKFEVLGHSLGASDAQRALEYLAHVLAKKGENTVSEMNLFAFNSPNVESDIAKRFIDSVEKLKIPFNMHYFDVHHDLVQEFGTKRIGYCGSKKACPDNLSTTVVKFNRNLLERIEAFAKNLFSQAKYLFYKEFEAHCEYSFKLHDKDDAAKYNTTFIQNIYTTSPQETGLLYGKNVNKVSKLIPQKDMDGHLLTNSGRIGRKLKKFGYDVLHVLSFGQWSHDYAPGHISLKKEEVTDSAPLKSAAVV